MLLQSDWKGRMFVITVLRVVVARAFSIVVPERDQRHNLQAVNDMTTMGVREQNTLGNIQDAGKRPVVGIFQENLQVLRP